MTTPALFDAFNARALDSAEVARRYVYSAHLPQVAESFHTVVIGPRGSGKTTLLKMLTLPALAAWEDDRKPTVIDPIDYVAIYVPSDFSWNPQFRRPIPGHFQKDADDLFSRALFSAYVKLAVCDSLASIERVQLDGFSPIPQISFNHKSTDYEAFLSALRSAWGLEDQAGGTFGLRRSVAHQIRRIQHALAHAAVKGSSTEEIAETHPLVLASIFDDLSAFADLYAEYVGSHHKWALCIDELEIAPSGIKEQIWQSARSFDQRFRLKLSASPFDESLTELYSPMMPMRGHDFRYINLTEQESSSVARFSEEIVERMTEERIGRTVDARRLLGASIFDDGDDSDDDGARRLAEGGLYHRAFVLLARKDKSFAQYLGDRRVDLNRMAQGSESRKAQLRKLISLAVWRENFLFAPDLSNSRGPSRKRLRGSRSIPAIYTGGSSLFRLCEGNPRWLIGIVDPLIADFETSRKSASRSRQSAAIQNAITSMFMLLSTLGDDQGGPDGMSIVSLLDIIGQYFTQEILGQEFKPDPVLTFRLDSLVSDRIRGLVGVAVNQGALVVIPDRQPREPGSLKGARLRLSYLLGPHYKLPPIKGRDIALSTIIRRHSRPPEVGGEQLLLDSLFEAQDD